jgi:uncharacterized protein (DUF885 family)
MPLADGRSGQNPRNLARDAAATRGAFAVKSRETPPGYNAVMRKPLSPRTLLLLSWTLSILLPATRAAAAGESERLHRLFDAAWDFKVREIPEFATYVGFPGHNFRWTDFSPAGIEHRHALLREQLKTAQSIDRSRLAATEQVDLDLFVRRMSGKVDGFRFPADLLALTQTEGIQFEVPRALNTAPASSLRGYEDLLARMNAVPALVDQTLALLQKGLATGVTSPKSLMTGAPGEIRALLTDDPWQSPLLARFRQISANVDSEDEARLRLAALHAYREKMAPAFRKLLSYLDETYIPGARESISLGALPDGAAWYAYGLRQATTTDLTPKQIHEMGFSEVKRIRAEMDRVIAGTGFQGSFADFVRFLHTDPRFFYDKPEDLVEGYRAVAQRIDLKLASLFGTLPHLSYRVLPIAAAVARERATAYYEPGSPASSRPGSCFVNTSDLKARPKWEMEALALHECIPGHHLQVSIAQTLHFPKWYNYHDYTPFVEGWGVYAESLGDDLGFYRDPYLKFGQLTYEMWRAMRLVVDTGIHSQGWTRQQAIDSFRENTAQDDAAIGVEIDRYINSPGLATAYKIGELKFKELRAYAQKELGPAFDIREFHDEVLQRGAVPLDLLEQNVKAWVAARRLRPGKALV